MPARVGSPDGTVAVIMGRVALTPTVPRFRALARSSPWRWRSLRFTASWTGPRGTWPMSVRAWVRRPHGLRVETQDGELISAGRSGDRSASRTILTRDGRGGPVWQPVPAADAAPVLDADGLVATRPAGWLVAYDDPMFRDYRWVAMLDPVELADGERRELADPAPEPATVEQLHEVDHAGRPAWEALLRPTQAYDPRCSCCPLLYSWPSARRDLDSGSTRQIDDDPAAYASAHRVRLDVGTGVCVLTREVGGPTHGRGHDLVIEAVDPPMPDALFQPPRGRRFGGSR
jgi:hypothetical protein